MVRRPGAKFTDAMIAEGELARLFICWGDVFNRASLRKATPIGYAASTKSLVDACHRRNVKLTKVVAMAGVDIERRGKCYADTGCQNIG